MTDRTVDASYPRRSRAADGLLALFGLVLVVPLAAQVITEYPLPAGGDPDQIATGPDGALWFTESGSGRIGRITTNGTITEFVVPTAGGFPFAIAAGPDGALWFTEQTAGRIGRITTRGDVSEFPIPDASTPWGIAAGPDGALWFTEYTARRIGRIGLDGLVTEFPLPNQSPSNSLWSIIDGPDGALWFQGEGGIGRITASGVITIFAPSLSDGISGGPDGALWFPSCRLFPRLACSIDRMTANGVVTQFPVGSGLNGFNLGITAGPDGAVWFTERYGNSLGRITLDGSVTHFPIPTADAFPKGIAAGPDGAIWFTEFGAGRIGRISMTGCGAPERLCLDGDAFDVAVTWKSLHGSSGIGKPVSLTGNSGYFWFFDRDNPEVIVKILDGCGINGHQWFFAAGLTNLEVDLTVTSRATGQSQTYSNPEGAVFTPVIDAGALPCPTSDVVAESARTP